MPDELRSPIKHHLVLHRIDPEQGVRRFYWLMIERDLFGTIRLVCHWRAGRNNKSGDGGGVPYRGRSGVGAGILGREPWPGQASARLSRSVRFAS
jgi:hypothetical protein